MQRYTFFGVLIGLSILSLEAKKQSSFFSWPIPRDRFWLSSRFGFRRMPKGFKRFHYGIDMAAHKGTPVLSAADGIVTRVAYDRDSGYGNMIQIKHKNGYQTRYAHLNSINVQEKQAVKEGQYIGTVGDTGLTFKQGTDASHLHFEIHEQGKQIDPLPLLPA